MPGTTVHVLQHELSESECTALLASAPATLARAQAIAHPRTRLCHLASRVVLHNALPGALNRLRRDAYGRPMLEEGKPHISLSHSDGLAALLTSDTLRAGVDVERLDHKRAHAIAAKFLNAEELAWAATQDAAIYPLLWSAKEAVYKWYGRKQVLFAEQIHLRPFLPHPLGMIEAAFCLPNGSWLNLAVGYRMRTDFLVAWCLAPESLLP